MSKHTPGPWKITDNWCFVGVDIIGPDDEYVVHDTDLNGAINNIADAHLISAAPDLLDALKDLVGATKHLESCPATLEKAIAAIENATRQEYKKSPA